MFVWFLLIVQEICLVLLVRMFVSNYCWGRERVGSVLRNIVHFNFSIIDTALSIHVEVLAMCVRACNMYQSIAENCT